MAIVTSQSRLFFRCCSLSLSLSLSGSFPRTNEAAVYSRESTFFNCVPRRQPARGESILAALVVGRIPETRALQKPSNSQKREREREREREKERHVEENIASSQRPVAGGRVSDPDARGPSGNDVSAFPRASAVSVVRRNKGISSLTRIAEPL